MWELLFLLLPLAAISGWILGRRRVIGLSDLFAKRKDKGAQLFVQWLESNQETVETHLTLGSLFRRRGEVDKAIGIHQNLITKPTLTDEQRALSLLELSRDYMRAGVLDRAENILLELVKEGREVEQACQHLIDIYQQSKDWQRAIEAAERLAQKTGRNMKPQIAHYYCEFAEQRWLRGESDTAREYLKLAHDTNPKSVRASLLLGDIESNTQNFKAAIRAYEQVARQDQAFLAEVVFPLAKCYEGIGDSEGMANYLAAHLEKDPSFSAVLAYSDWLKKSQGIEEARKFVLAHLSTHPSIRGIHRLIEFSMARAEGSTKTDLELLHDMVQNLVVNKPLYRCRSCGFSGRTLQWQCPGCKRWDVIKPIQE